MEVLLRGKVQCVSDSKPTALETDTRKSKRRTNRN